MPLTRIDSAFLDLDALGGIDFDVQSGVPTFSVDAANHKVGIGTASPDQYLDVESNSNTSARITAHGYICRDNWGSQTGMGNGMFSPAANTLAFTTNSVEKLRITSAGKLEAYKGTSTTGKTSGSEAFTVGNGAGNHRFAVYPDGTTVIGGTGDITNNNIILQNDGMIFAGVATFSHAGTSTPTNQITLNTPSCTTGGGSGIFLKSSGSDTVNRYGTRIHTIREAANNGASSLVISNENAGATGLTEALRIDSSGDATFTGDLVFSTAGKGVCLGVTSNTDANTLDDYEEGTFTPAFDTFSSSSTVDYSITNGLQRGRYTKIGDTVHYYLYLLFTVSGWGSGTWRIKDLPFNAWISLGNTHVQSAKMWWKEAGGTTVYKLNDDDYNWDHWWNRNQLFAADTTNEAAYRPTTATDLQYISITIMGTYFVN